MADTVQAKRSIVLIVDDEPVVRQLLERQLSAMGFEVIVASSGEEALQCSDFVHVDLVLLDIMMPGIGGLATLEKIRQKNTIAPVIMLTAVADNKVGERAMALGATDYLVKPVDLQTLKKAVQYHLLLSH